MPTWKSVTICPGPKPIVAVARAVAPEEDARSAPIGLMSPSSLIISSNPCARSSNCCTNAVGGRSSVRGFFSSGRFVVFVDTSLDPPVVGDLGCSCPLSGASPIGVGLISCWQARGGGLVFPGRSPREGSPAAGASAAPLVSGPLAIGGPTAWSGNGLPGGPVHACPCSSVPVLAQEPTSGLPPDPQVIGEAHQAQGQRPHHPRSLYEAARIPTLLSVPSLASRQHAAARRTRRTANVGGEGGETTGDREGEGRARWGRGI